MANQIIDTGAADNDGNGETVRSAFTKSNANFLELFNRPYVIGFFAGGDFADGEVFFRHTIKENATFRFYDADGQTPNVLTGSPPATGTAPSFTVETADSTTERIFTITKNGVSDGTVTFDALATTGTPSFTAGFIEATIDDDIRMVAPTPVGAEINGLSVTLLGFRS